MKPIKHSRGEVTRHAIREAAEAVFAEVGYSAARLEDVANAVGIRRPSIVYYFTGKQELYDAVEADIFASMHACLTERMAGHDDPFEQVIALLDAWLDFMVARPTAARIIQRLVADVTPRRGNPTEFSETALEDIERVIAAGVKAGAFDQIAPMHFLNGVAGSVLFYVCNGGQIGENRRYDPGNPQELARFRALLHRITAAALMPQS